MAFYVQHSTSATTQQAFKAQRQEGFHLPPAHPSLNAPPSPTTPFGDPSNPNNYFGSSGAFPNAFKRLNDGNNPMDLVDTLASLVGDDRQRHGPHHHSNGIDYNPGQANQHNPHAIFDINSFPTHHLNGYNHSTFRGTPDSGIGTDSPTAVGHNFFGDPPLTPAAVESFHHAFAAASSLPRINTMATNQVGLGSPASEHIAYPPSPFVPSNAPPINSATTATASRSRSRTRTATTGRAPTASRSRVGKKRTQSISSPSPPGTSSGHVPSAIVIPDVRSPSETSWMFSPSSAQTSFSLPAGSGGNAYTLMQGSNAPSVIPEESKPDAPVTASSGKDDPASKQAALLNEKRRRRRESHNAVERRRRDNINEKINELSTLIPDCLMLETGNGDGFDGDLTTIATEEELIAGGSGVVSAGAANAMKANKGIILRKSVDYIRQLQQLVRTQAVRNQEMEQELASYRAAAAGQAVSLSQLHHISPSPSADHSSGSGSDMNHAFDNAANFINSSPFLDHATTSSYGNAFIAVKEEPPSAASLVGLTPISPTPPSSSSSGNPLSLLSGLGPSTYRSNQSPVRPPSSASFHQAPLLQRRESVTSVSTSMNRRMSQSTIANGNSPTNGGGEGGSDVDMDEDEDEMLRGRNSVRNQARRFRGFSAFDGSALSEGEDEDGDGDDDDKASR